MDWKLFDEIGKAFEELSKDDTVRVVIVSLGYCCIP
jgi:hypothetical protein